MVAAENESWKNPLVIFTSALVTLGTVGFFLGLKSCVLTSQFNISFI